MIKITLAISTLFLASCSLFNKDHETAAHLTETNLPGKWPPPGPFNQVAEKNYPPYRAAHTQGDSETKTFVTLFQHIQANSIPMTAPVEIQMAITPDGMKQKGMGFLYQNTTIGKRGTYGGTVEVRDTPALKTLSYTWKGKKNKASLKIAKDILTKEIINRSVKPKQYRLLGYHGPGTPKAQRTWELQAILP